MNWKLFLFFAAFAVLLPINTGALNNEASIRIGNNYIVEDGNYVGSKISGITYDGDILTISNYDYNKKLYITNCSSLKVNISGNNNFSSFIIDNSNVDFNGLGYINIYTNIEARNSTVSFSKVMLSFKGSNINVFNATDSDITFINSNYDSIGNGIFDNLTIINSDFNGHLTIGSDIKISNSSDHSVNFIKVESVNLMIDGGNFSCTNPDSNCIETKHFIIKNGNIDLNSYIGIKSDDFSILGGKLNIKSRVLTLLLKNSPTISEELVNIVDGDIIEFEFQNDNYFSYGNDTSSMDVKNDKILYNNFSNDLIIKKYEKFKVVSGSNQKVAGSEVTFKIDTSDKYLKEVLVNDIVLSSENDYYTDGDKIILKKEYISSLEKGKYKLKLNYLDGEASADFYIHLSNPDTISIFLVIILCLIIFMSCFIGLYGKMILKRRRRF